jgi:hypothetical protein
MNGTFYINQFKEHSSFDLKIYFYSILDKEQLFIKGIKSLATIKVWLSQVGRAVKAVDLSPTGRKPAQVRTLHLVFN